MDNSDYIEILISKFLAGEASPEEAMELEDWKSKDPQNLKQFVQSQKLFALLNKQATTLKSNKQKAWHFVASQTINNTKVITLQKRYRLITGMAATLLLLIGIYFLINKQDAILNIHYHTIVALQKVKHIDLNDHTKIDLKPGSTLLYNQQFGTNNRMVKLKGDAYFTVTHNERLPFIVDLGAVYVKDLGTRFDIKLSADTDSIYLRVDEGIVLLFDSASNAIEINASERALYIKSTKQLISNKQLIEASNPLNFENAKLSFVIEQLEKQFSNKIMLANPLLKDCKISVNFQKEDLATMLSVITETLGLTYQKQNDVYIISGQACN